MLTKLLKEVTPGREALEAMGVAGVRVVKVMSLGVMRVGTGAALLLINAQATIRS